MNNGGCSHLCLLKAGGQGYTCQCPDHFLTVQIGGVARCLPSCSSTQYRCADNERWAPRTFATVVPVCDLLLYFCFMMIKTLTFLCLNNCSFLCLFLCSCIPIWWKCDGQRDCRDGSDEPSTCPPRHCRLGQFQCNDGNCTSPHFLCNSNHDCPDGSDEDAVLCGMKKLNHHSWCYRCAG